MGAKKRLIDSSLAKPLFQCGIGPDRPAKPGKTRRSIFLSAHIGGIPPEGGIEAAYKRQLAEAADPVAFREELMARIESVRGPVGPLSKFQIEEMIDPRDTRRLVCEWLETVWRVLSHPDRLAPRPLQFRP